MAGTFSRIIHYVLIAAMHMRATGNSEGIVKRFVLGRIRSEASEKMCAQRLGKPEEYSGSRRRTKVRNGRLCRNTDEDIV